MAKKKKLFVLDTNVVLHDSACIYQFKEHDVIIPVTLLEELDAFKKGNESINFHAREFARNVDAMSGDHIFNGGVKIGAGLGKISVRLEQNFHKDLQSIFNPANPDHQILNCAYCLWKENPSRDVILVSKDVNLRMKSKAVGIPAQDYKNDQVQNITELYTGHRTVENVEEEVIQQLHSNPYEIHPEDLPTNHFVPNEYMILRNGKQSALATFDAERKAVVKVDKNVSYGISPKNAEQIFALNALMNPDIQLVTISGKAGTGKTLLALAAALEKRKYYRQIFMARPIVPLSNKDIGYLPGDIHSKLDPYMTPLFDNLGVIKNQYPESDQNFTRITQMMQEEKLVIEPLSYIRGRSLVKIFFIVDEAQNLTPHEVKTIITRAGEGTKIVLTGDIYQIDHPYLDSQSNGLSYLIAKMQGQKIYAHINLEKGERSKLAELASNLL
ncbi:MAG: PhoH family protein [Ignavibacteriales bacterium]|nr:PhoH family protein [Ignavibacteriales bacterium]